MRIKLLAAAALTVLMVATAAVIVSCQDGTTAPTRAENPAMDDDYYVIVQGTLKDAFGVNMHEVEVWCDCGCGGPCGYFGADTDGWYEIIREDTFPGHNGHTLYLYAENDTHAGSGSVPNFNSANIPYTVNITMYPK